MKPQRDIPHFISTSVAPTSEPVTLAEVKSQCAIDAPDFDDQLRLLMQAAREMVEADTDLRLMPQTIVLRLDAFPATIQINTGPLTAISSITYIDEAGSTQTLSSSLYRADIYSRPGRIWLADGQFWPETDPRPNAVSVTATAGFASASLVPAVAKQAILLLVADWWKNRESMAAPGEAGAAIRTTYDNLIRRLKMGMYP